MQHAAAPLCYIRKNIPFAQKYVVQHIKIFAYIKKKQYLCNVKPIGYVNIILIIVSIILAKLVILRILLRIAGVA